MAEYCEDDDLLLIRPDITSLGVSSWEEQILEAGRIIDRALDAQWYRAVARDYGIDFRETPFDRALILNADSQVKRLGCYKTLELAYLYLSKNRQDDAFTPQSKSFRKLYKDELAEVLRTGLDYDWDEDDSISSSESAIPAMRRLQRV
jgi:hypothetical protein